MIDMILKIVAIMFFGMLFVFLGAFTVFVLAWAYRDFKEGKKYRNGK